MTKGKLARRFAVPLMCAAAVIYMALPASAAPKASHVKPAATIFPAHVLGSGSDTTFDMMTALDGLYNESAGCNVIAPTGQTQPLDFSCLADTTGTITTENYAHDQVQEAFPLGSSVGLNQLCEKGQSGVASIDFDRSSRAPKTSDCSGEHFVAYARDGIPFEAFPSIPGSPAATMNNQSGTCAGSTGFCLTQQNMKDIFVNCTITNWNQIGGPSATIEIWAPQNGSGTKGQMDTFLGGDSDTCASRQDPNHIVPENQNNSILASSDPGNAIFYFSWGDWNFLISHHPDGSKLGSIDGVAPTTTTIQNGSFPYGRYLYNVYCSSSCAAGASSAATVNYVGETGWLCKAANKHAKDPFTGINYRTEVANLIKAQGFVALANGPIGGGVSGNDFCRLTVQP